MSRLQGEGGLIYLDATPPRYSEADRIVNMAYGGTLPTELQPKGRPEKWKRNQKTKEEEEEEEKEKA